MRDKFEPINKENVVDQIISVITDSVVKGKYKPGMKLPSEYELIEELKVSRNSLREAMKILSAMGVVEIKRGDGTYICSEMKTSVFDNAVFGILYEMSTDDELQELRQIVDEEVARLAMQKVTKEEIKALRANIGEMEQALQAGDYDQTEKLDFTFHQMLIDACKNKFYPSDAGVYAIFEKSIINTVEYEKEMSPVEHHQKILRCVEEKDTEHIAGHCRFPVNLEKKRPELKTIELCASFIFMYFTLPPQKGDAQGTNVFRKVKIFKVLKVGCTSCRIKQPGKVVIKWKKCYFG